MNEPDEAEATAIYQRLLDQIGATYSADDFDSFTRFVHVPHRFITEGEEKLIETTAQLQDGFSRFRDYLAGIMVTDFVRFCTGAMFLSETRILGGHTTELISHGNRVHDPYEVWSMLERIDGHWKVTGSRNAIADTSWQAIALGKSATSIERQIFTPSHAYTPKTGERT